MESASIIIGYLSSQLLQLSSVLQESRDMLQGADDIKSEKEARAQVSKMLDTYLAKLLKA